MLLEVALVHEVLGVDGALEGALEVVLDMRGEVADAAVEENELLRVSLVPHRAVCPPPNPTGILAFFPSRAYC